MLLAVGKGLDPLPLLLGGNLPAKQTPVVNWSDATCTGVEMLPWSSQQRWEHGQLLAQEHEHLCSRVNSFEPALVPWAAQTTCHFYCNNNTTT